MENKKPQILEILNAIRDSALAFEYKAVLNAIALRWSDSAGAFKTSYKTIVNDTGLSRRNVIEHVAILRTVRILRSVAGETNPKGGSRVSCYHIDLATILRVPTWKQMPELKAVRTGQVHGVNEDYVPHASQRVVQTAELFARLIHPELK